MKLLVAMITYNRLAYTKRTLESFLATVNVPYFLVVADNASTDGTQEWLKAQHSKGKINHLILNNENFYPGMATNEAWSAGMMYYPEATHLMRLDNDIELSPGWSMMAERYFKTIPNLGQLGLDVGPTLSEDAQHFWETHNGMEINPFPGNVGGPNIIRRKVWDKGIRYDESKWWHDEDVPTAQEDTKLSQDISLAGWLFGHPREKLAETIDKWEDYPEYFIKTLTDRGYGEVFKDKIEVLKGLVDEG
jgi:glycosyltransferase involved in cell wall biosynthesis